MTAREDTIVAAAFDEVCEALRLTVEYVGTATLPPVEGWSWYDALKKYRPEVAQQMLDRHNRIRA